MALVSAFLVWFHVDKTWPESGREESMSLTSVVEMEAAGNAVGAEEVEQQLARMLESRHFCHSHRYPALLKYLVEQTLAGNARQLKERTLGIEVFHRSPDYDTNNDPVVRVTAAEVRKRIAQYYQEPEHRDELRIDIPTGSYVPRFFRLDPQPAPSHPAAASEHSDQSAPSAEAQTHTPEAHPAVAELSARSSRFWLWALACLGAGILLAVGILRVTSLYTAWQERALRAFWAPVTGNQLPVVVVIGDHTIGAQGNALRADQGAAVNPNEDVLQLMNEHEQVTMHDVTSLFKVMTYLVRHDRSYTLLGAGTASIDNLRNNPVILFAGLDNRWTMRLGNSLRYRFVDSPDDSVGIIADSKDPSRRWQVDFKVPYKSLPADYAIVARYTDPLIEQPVMIAAGIGENGTISASDFVTSEKFLEDMDKLAPKGWKNGNVELVLECRVIDGQPAPPHIVASQFW